MAETIAAALGGDEIAMLKRVRELAVAKWGDAEAARGGWIFRAELGLNSATARKHFKSLLELGVLRVETSGSSIVTSLTDAGRAFLAERDRRAQDGPEPADRATEHVFPAVYAHLAAARDGGLKTPGMRLLNAAGDGPGVRLKMMGERSRHRGRVMVADPRGAGDDRLYGFIDADGSFRARGATPQGVLMSLTLVNDDPAGEAARYGQQTGNCCYCDIELTTPESRAAGYGPDCAAHRGLPWGKKRQPVPAVAPEPEPVADPYAGLSVADQVAAGLIEGPTYRDFPGEERAFDPEAQDETDRDDGSFWEEMETLRAGGYF